jgi:hypothetical protein
MYIHEMTTKNVVFATALLFAAPFVAAAQSAPATMPAVPTTRILAIGHLTAGTTRAAIMPVMKQEVPDTVRLYLAGKIDQWYTRKDQNGVVFILNCSTVEEAHALLEKLPLGQAKLMEFDLIPLGPLSPLNLLLPQDTSSAAK